jgi:hypothetical protein
MSAWLMIAMLGVSLDFVLSPEREIRLVLHAYEILVNGEYLTNYNQIKYDKCYEFMNI